jgi:hypothetical protein
MSKTPSVTATPPGTIKPATEPLCAVNETRAVNGFSIARSPVFLIVTSTVEVTRLLARSRVDF